MKKTEKNYPFPAPDKKQDSLSDYYCPSASWGDMTGLIPYSAVNDGAVASYEDVYPFLPGYIEDESVNNDQN